MNNIADISRIASAAPAEASHLTHASASGWTLWRDCVVRSAGLPAERVAALAHPSLGSAAHGLLEAIARTNALLSEVANSLGRRIDTHREHSADKQGNSDEPTLKTLQRAIKAVRQRTFPSSVRQALDADEVQAIHFTLSQESEAHAAFVRAYQAAEDVTSSVLAAACRDPWFIEAVTWQNHAAVESALLPLGGEHPMTGSRRKQREALVSNYLQRYALKNDTIGFFGPITWARIEANDRPPRYRSGSQLVRNREVRFEDWPIRTLAECLARQDGMFDELVPRAHPFSELDGNRLRMPGGATIELTQAEMTVLRACNGEVRCHDIAQRILADPFSMFDDAGEVYEVLRSLEAKDRLWIGFSISHCDPYPERTLRAQLERIASPALRESSVEILDRLCLARDSVSAAAGDVQALQAALKSLDAEFKLSTGAQVRRRPGEAYGGRALVYEDCHRDLDVDLTEASLAPIRSALDCVLQSARWFTSESGDLFHDLFLDLHTDLHERTGRSEVRFADFWLHAQTLLFADSAELIAPLGRELRRRWQTVLDRHLTAVSDGHRYFASGDQLSADIAAAFPSDGAGWVMARHQCPDLMFCAADAQALLDGEYLAVLGEVHIGGNTLATNLFTSQHPRPAALQAAIRSDLSAPYVCPKLSADASTTPVRTQWVDDAEQCREILFSHGVIPANPVSSMDISELRIHMDSAGVLQVKHRAGSWQSPLLDVVGDFLFLIVLNQFGVVERRPHTPRITIDNLVVQRERWAFSMPELSSLTSEGAGEDCDAFLAARKWQSVKQLPDRVFVKVAWEDKPFFLDFDSPILVRNFIKQLRGADKEISGHPVVVTEMLPDLHQLWLSDAQGRRYTSELRVVCAHIADVSCPSPDLNAHIAPMQHNLETTT